MSVKKRKGTPHYWYDFTVGGNRFRGSTETNDLEAAKAIEGKLRLDAVLGKHLKRKPRMTMDIAFGRYWLEHGQHCASSHNAMKGFALNLLAHFGKNIYLDELDDAKISAYKSQRMKEKGKRGKPVSPATINRHLGYLRSILNMAKNQWGVDTGDLHINKHFLQEPEARTRWITAKEAQKLIDMADGHLKPVIRFALLTGLRLGNIADLRWEQIRFKEKTIEFQVKSKLPGRKLHALPISKAMLDLLISQQPKKSGFVFTYKGRGVKNFRRAFSSACKKAGLKDFRFHDLRHTAASWMRQNGVPIEVVQKVLGHADIATTMKYAHLHDDEKAQALNALGKSQPKAQIRHIRKKKVAA